MRRIFPLVLLLSLVGGGVGGATRHHRPVWRPRAALAHRSPCGRHQVTFVQGATFVDGQRVQAPRPSVQLIGAPTWRADGDAVAWLERASGELRLIVVPTVAGRAPPMTWTLPRTLGRDRRSLIFWAGKEQIVVGTGPLQPRAIASWTTE